MERDLQLNAIDLFQKEIVTIYKEKKLRSISGLDMDFVIGDRQVLAWFFTAVRKGQNKFKKVFSIHFQPFASLFHPCP